MQDYWLPTPFASFPFTSPPVRHRVPSHSDSALPVVFASCMNEVCGCGERCYGGWCLSIVDVTGTKEMYSVSVS